MKTSSNVCPACHKYFHLRDDKKCPHCRTSLWKNTEYVKFKKTAFFHRKNSYWWDFKEKKWIHTDEIDKERKLERRRELI